MFISINIYAQEDCLDGPQIISITDDCFIDENCQGSNQIISVQIEGGMAPYEVIINDELLFSTSSQPYIDIFGYEIPSPYSLIIADANACADTIMGTHNCLQYLESCIDNIRNNDEVRIDCGGDDCADCMQLRYGMYCSFPTGELNMTIYTPTDAVPPFCITGDLNDTEVYDSPIVFSYASDTEVPLVRILDSAGKMGVIYDTPLVSCGYPEEVILHDLCPEESNFDVDFTVRKNDTTQLFYIDYEISGNPPFGIIDYGSSDPNLIKWNEIVFFDRMFEDSSYTIGPLNYNTGYNILVHDSLGCRKNSSFYVLPSPIDTSSTAINDSPSKLTTLSLSPNPLTPISRLQLHLNQKAKAKLQVFNHQGQLVKTIIDTALNTGSYEWPAYDSSYEKGMYFFVLQIGDEQWVSKGIYL